MSKKVPIIVVLGIGLIVLSGLFVRPASFSSLYDADYVGASACGECHTNIYPQWQRSPHARMTREASDESVAGNFNNDCVVNAIDLGQFRLGFFGANPLLDFNGDGAVNVVDLGVLRLAFFSAPGPGGLASICDQALPGALRRARFLP